MNIIRVYIGKHVERLVVHQSNECQGPKLSGHGGLEVNGMVSLFPEDRRYPRFLREYLKSLGVVQDVLYKEQGLDILTHSMNVIGLLGGWVQSGIVSHEDVSIYILSDDNKSFDIKTGFDNEGYLLPNWPIGFLSI